MKYLKYLKYLEIVILVLLVYSLALSIKWQYEGHVIVKELLTDILDYDLQLFDEYESFISSGNKMEAKAIAKLFISSDYIVISIWWVNWNILDWGEAKYIRMPARHTIMKRLNHWRNTGEYLYNITKSNIKSV